MPMLVLFVVGIGLLIVGAELLVRGATRLAAALGVTPLIIGLTVVAFGTSAPEVAVSVDAGLRGHADIALGNVIGSNVFNVLFILGVSALATPLVVAQRLLWFDVPLMIGISLLVWVLSLDHMLGRWEGLLLCLGLVAYVVWAIRGSRRESEAVQDEYAETFRDGAWRTAWQVVGQCLMILVGLGLLVLGARWLVQGAVAFAQVLGMSELIISLTIVAAGTSLPEVATSVLAAIRGERDVAVGNVIGSCIFNLLGVLGLAAVFAPAGIAVAPATVRFDMPVMLAASLACLPIFFTEHRIARWEGGVFLVYYLAYTIYLILKATAHDALPVFSWVMLGFVLPLTVITLTGGVVRAVRKRHLLPPSHA